GRWPYSSASVATGSPVRPRAVRAPVTVPANLRGKCRAKRESLPPHVARGRPRHSPGGGLAVPRVRGSGTGPHDFRHVAPPVGPGAVGVGETVLLGEPPARQRLPGPAEAVGV